MLDLCLIQRTLTVSTSAKSSVLAHGASWPLSTAKNPQHRRIEDGASCGTCRGNRPVENCMLLIVASHTRLVHFDTYWCNARACCGFTSVLFTTPTTRVWIWGSWRNPMGLRGFSHVRLLGECLDSLQYIHTTGGTSGCLLMDRPFVVSGTSLWSVESPLLLGVAEGGGVAVLQSYYLTQTS